MREAPNEECNIRVIGVEQCSISNVEDIAGEYRFGLNMFRAGTSTPGCENCTLKILVGLWLGWIAAILYEYVFVLYWLVPCETTVDASKIGLDGCPLDDAAGVGGSICFALVLTAPRLDVNNMMITIHRLSHKLFCFVTVSDRKSAVGRRFFLPFEYCHCIEMLFS
jgi:hypothetical protein